MPQVALPFPKLGLVRTFQRSVQTGNAQGYYAQFQPESTWNALNVVPYDRNDRLRGGQRGGTLTQVTLNSGTLNPAVTALAQGTTYPTPTASTPINVAFPGTYTVTTPAANLQTASSNAWLVYCGQQPGLSCTFGASYPTGGLVFSDGVTSGGDTKRPFALQTLDSQFTDNYTLTQTLAFSPVSTYSGGLVFRYDVGTTNGLFLYFVYATGTWSGGTGPHVTVTLSYVSSGGNVMVLNTKQLSAVSATPTGVTLSVTVAGSLISWAIGGNFVASMNTTWGTGNLGVGPWMTDVSLITSFIATSATIVARTVNVIAVAGTAVYVGTSPSTLAVAGNGGSTAITPGQPLPQIAFVSGAAYIVDGTNILQVDATTQAMVTYAATTGTAPVGATLAAVYRGRLVLANTPGFPQDFFMSRVGVVTDWDYSQVDEAAAFAGNASTLGRIGEPITALMPFTDDVMLIGGDRNLWRINGDPAAGGTIDLVSDQIGVFGPNAWTKDPMGNIWFMGTGGLFKIAPGGQPQNMSSALYNLEFTLLDRTQVYPSLAWDRDLQGLYIFFTPNDSTLAALNLFYDARNGGLWPFSYPTGFDPACVITYDGNSNLDRYLLLGSKDGNVRSHSLLNLNDDGMAIASILSFGPFQPAGPGKDATITRVNVSLGENVLNDGSTSGAINAIVTVRGGKTANEVTQGTSRHTAARTYSYAGGGYQLPMVVRVRGGWFAVELFNSTLNSYFQIEQLNVEFEIAGQQR